LRVNGSFIVNQSRLLEDLGNPKEKLEH